MDDLTTYISLAIVTKKLLNASAIISELDSVLLFMIMDLICLWVCLIKADNRSNAIPGFLRVVSMFFKIVLVVIWLIDSYEFVNCVLVNIKVL